MPKEKIIKIDETTNLIEYEIKPKMVMVSQQIIQKQPLRKKKKKLKKKFLKKKILKRD